MSELSAFRLHSVLNKTINRPTASRHHFVHSYLIPPSADCSRILAKLEKIQTTNIFTATRTLQVPPRHRVLILFSYKKPAAVSMCAPWDATPNCIQLRNLLVKRHDNSNYYRFRTSQGANSPENNSLSRNACFGHSAVADLTTEQHKPN